MVVPTRSSGKRLRSRVIVKLHPTNVKFRVSPNRVSKRNEEGNEHDNELLEILSDKEEECQSSSSGMRTPIESNIMISISADEWNEIQRRLRQADVNAELLRRAHRTAGVKDRAMELLTSQIDAAQKSIKSNREYLLDHLVCFTCGDLLRNPYILPTCGHTFCHGCVIAWGEACGRARAQLRREVINPAEPPFYLQCPTCRSHEDNPVQNFFVKSLVAAMVEQDVL